MFQKSYTVDFLTKRKKKNEGEIPQYYVENSHEAIISPEVFDMVQYEFEKRKDRMRSGASCFSSKICKECGSFYGPKVWHSPDKYRQVIWRTVLYNSMEKLIEKNSSFKINKTEYNKHYEKFKKQYYKINRELAEIEGEKLKYKVRKQKVQDFINKLRENEKLLTEFDETLWHAMVERVVVSNDGSVSFEFKR